jgi:hypothetical protein
MHDRMVARTELSAMGEKIVELVPVQGTDDRIGIGGPGGADGIQPLCELR